MTFDKRTTLADDASGGPTVVEDSDCARKWSPARLVGLFSVVSLALLSCGFLAIGGVFWEIAGLALTGVHRAAVGLHLLCYALLLTFCIIGLYGNTSGTRGYEILLCASLMGHALFAIGSGAYCLHFLFKPQRDVLEADYELRACIAVGNPALEHFCRRDGIAKGATLALFFVMWLLEILTLFATNWSIADSVRQESKAKRSSVWSTDSEWDAYYC